MSKYVALRDHLMNLKADHWQASFKEIEKVLGHALPGSARRYPAWWANQNPRSHVQCSGWLDAGWRTSNLNLSAESITFLRDGAPSDAVNDTDHKPTKSALRWDDVLHPINGEESSALGVNYSWRKLGKIFIDHRDRLSFPRTPIEPAIYRFRIKRRKGVEIYIGETDEISRRLQHYRTPGITQRTNQRLKAVMKDCLEDKGTVEISIIENASAAFGGVTKPLDLSEKLQRRLVEHAAIVAAKLSGQAVINL